MSDVIGYDEPADFGHNPEAPEAPDIGIEIGFGKAGEAPRFRKGEPVVLHGRYWADLDLLERHRKGLTWAIMLTVTTATRPGNPKSETFPLTTPHGFVPVRPPLEKTTADDPSYRSGGQFRVDLRRICRLLLEPGRYEIQASLDVYRSSRLAFEIV